MSRGDVTAANQRRAPVTFANLNIFASTDRLGLIGPECLQGYRLVTERFEVGEN